MFAPQAQAASPNDRLGVAIVGCGNRGNSLLRTLVGERETWNIEFPAICDVWSRNLGDTADRLEAETGRRPQVFARHEDLLALSEVDAVVIATPDLHHSPIMVDAARAGKHIYVEKPMANRMEDANAALDAVVENEVVCQVGTQRRSHPRYRAAAELLHTGVLGQLVVCEAGWNRNVPSWIRDYGDVYEGDVDWEQFLAYLPGEPFDARKFRCWHLYRDCALGLVNLLGSHVIDVIQWFSGDPIPKSAVGIETHAVWKDRENADTQEITYEFPSGYLLRHFSRLGNSDQPLETYMSGTNGVFDTTSWELRGAGAIDSPDRIEDNVVVGPEPDGPGMDWLHIENWIDCIRANRLETHADIHAGYAQSVAGVMGYLACHSGKKLLWDEATRSIKEA